MSASDPSISIGHPDEDESYSGWVGRVVDGRYRIDGLLGEGGMGAVFEAEHLKLMKQVALKVIHPEFAGDGEVAERFAREAMASAQMDHPHIAGAIDYGTLAEGGAYLVMQFVRGESLRDLIEDNGAISWVSACEVAAQVADALAEAHKRRIVHRDLKPDNVMLEPRDDGSTLVKVLDFGIARVADEKIASGGPALTRVGTVIGTPGYMAPEQALGEPVDFRIDIYSLGLLLFEMITGTRVFESDDLTAIVTRQLTEDAPRISERTDDVPAALDDLVAAMLTKDKTKRPESAAEVRDTLKAMLLNATIQRVASGEHALPNISATELAGAMRDPTPLKVDVQRPVTAPGAVAATMAASPASKPVVTRPKRTGIATARTQLAMEEAKRQVERVPVPARVAIGCGAALAALTFFVVIPWAIFGGDDPPPLVKQEHDEPIPPPEEPEDPDEDRVARPVPAALAQPLADLLLDERDSARRRAARSVLSHEPRAEVPDFLVAIAELEQGRRCEDKREQVAALQRLGDARALPVLERLSEEPRNGCGNVFRRQDCLRCLRGDLDAAIRTLRGDM